MFGSRLNEGARGLPGKDRSWRVLKDLLDVAERKGENKTSPLCPLGSELSSNPPSLSSWKPLQRLDLKEPPAAGTAQSEVPETDMSEVFCQGAGVLSGRPSFSSSYLCMWLAHGAHTLFSYGSQVWVWRRYLEKWISGGAALHVGELVERHTFLP